MQILDRTGVGTLWSICKTKFALKDHTHNYLPLSGGTLTGDLLFSDSGTTFRQIKGTCGGNDFWRIGGGAIKENAGYMEIATADDGTEPIYIRQYIGVFATAKRTATILDSEGNTSFPGTVAAAKFKGALEGNASTASNASMVNGHTVNSDVPSNAKFTDTNTWRPIQDNLTSTSTSESLSANQGMILKGLVDGKANSSHTHSWSQISGAPATATRWPSWGEVTGKPTIMGVGVEQVIDAGYSDLEISFQDQCADTYGHRGGNIIIGKFNSYKHIQSSQNETSYPVVNINYNICVIGSSASSWPHEPDLPGFIISDNVEQVGNNSYYSYTNGEKWYTKLYKIKDFNKTIYRNIETYLYYKLTEDGMKQCDSNGNILK